jgi:flagellar protein FlgJ
VSLSTTGALAALELKGFASLRHAARERRAETAAVVARQFEALMLQSMVRSMRQATPGDPLLSSSSTRLYRDLFDQQLALRLSESGTVGLADLLVRQLRESGALREEVPAAEPEADALRRGLYPSRSGPARGAGEAEGEGERSAELRAVASASAAAREPLPFAGREAFVRAVRPHAERAGRALGVDPGMLVAQAALETGWGRSVLQHADGRSAFNLFGIKANPAWTGDVVTVPTLEYEGGVAVRRNAAFRAYPSFAESFDDYVDLLRGNPRYARALAQADDPRAYMQALQAAGYATDPRYAEKVIRIWEGELGGRLALAER